MTWRIQRSTKGNVLTFSLIGRIEAEAVAELEVLLKVEGQDHRTVLDLKEVKLVDRDAVRFLARCEMDGNRLENCPAYIREWILREPT